MSVNRVRLLLAVPVPWVFILTYLLGVGLQVALRTPALHGAGVAGGVLFGIGAAIAAWGLTIFHREHTTTTPGQTSRQLVTSGPYRFSRNPMYVGLTLAYLGEAGMLGQPWPVVVLPLVLAYVNWIVIPLEETRLRETFGAEYEAYRTRVRRWI